MAISMPWEIILCNVQTFSWNQDESSSSSQVENIKEVSKNKLERYQDGKEMKKIETEFDA